MPKETVREEVVKKEQVEQEGVIKVYTQEEVDKGYVSRAEYDTLNANYQKIITAFNKLMDEYNQLHIQTLLNEAK